MTTAASKNLAQKLLAIVEAIPVVEKKGINPEHHYAFQRAADVMLAVRQEALKQGVLLLPSIRREADTAAKSGTPIANISGTLTAIDADNPADTLTVEFTGAGMDTQDKGPYKAITTGLKYALRGMFQIPDENDVEATSDEVEAQEEAGEHVVGRNPDKPITPRQKGLLAARLREVGLVPSEDRTKDFLQAVVGKRSSKDLVSGDVDTILTFLEGLDEAGIDAQFPV